ncbi:hypothetical protein GON26_20510 [Flavobacterium sp. GA093]|uniref:Phage tail sheath protein n=1 Tax=Flavobacterium hydrocarbonoxydans TaxID=2683249 RepID=A0A6I4NRJ8_9FLAO|nr:DUF2586 family protein [Flavobacterium hydrocarbonoxydans]MWB96751.1 hypothetical protein [Flavobacterium hydrocarbonoxydans]
MSLPNIKFNISSKGLGLLQSDIQKVPGVVLTGATVTGTSKVTVGQSYQIFSLDEAVNLGIEETGTNAFAYQHIKAFYDEAKKGAELWFMLVLSTVKMEEMADITKPFAKKLLADASGKIRILGILKKSGTTETITDGLDADVALAVANSQALSEDYASRYFPVRVIVSGNKFSGTVADLKDYSTAAFNKVSILLANTDGSKEAAIGLALGRIASIPTQRKISRVKDGPVENFNAYFTNGLKAESLDTAWDAIHNKGYIFLRSFANRSGYFFTSDVTLTSATDDFNTLARGLVMDEAVLIAYDVLVDELSDEIPVSVQGTIHPATIKSWQNAVEQQINGLMVQQGKLSGAKAFIDENQNVLSTNNLDITLQLLPVGYSDYITVNIGFTTNLE